MSTEGDLVCDEAIIELRIASQPWFTLEIHLKELERTQWDSF